MAEYFVGYDEYLQKSDYDKVGKDFITANKELFRANKIISVGCGFGELDFFIINAVSPTAYAGIEPSKYMITRFEKTFQERKSTGAVKDIPIQLFNQKWEDYNSKEQYDLAIMWQCGYYLDLKTAIPKALEIAQKLLVVIMAPHSEFKKFYLHMHQKFDPPRPPPTNPGETPRYRDAGLIIDLFKDSEYEVKSVGPMEPVIQVAPISNELLEFLIHMKPEGIIREVADEYLAEHHKNGILVDYTDSLLITKKGK
eukprot:Phypoly_transcript_15556.p1 GENE.Phypoly_transcript_15556~~Phypoly_transcript_15556.p1  ORF type:complete len:254 (-),score=47.03 Phypoly_transcript_15556:26-787(-)